MLSIRRLGVALAVACASGAALAQVVTIPNGSLKPAASLYTNVFGTLMLTTGGGNADGVGDPTGRNDDGFRGPINFGYTLTNFFGQDYTQFFLNNNGNITFGAGLPAFTPEGPEGATVPVIAPFFADVDTRGANSGLVYYDTSIPNETIITWDHVGYFSEHDDKLDTFQLVVRGPGFNVPQGEGTIGFFYGDMQWETGDASGGTGGFGGTPAAAGFGDGQNQGFVLEGSTSAGISGTVDHKFVWFNVNDQGVPVPVPGIPEPETYALMLAGLGLLGAVARRRRGR